VFLRVGEHALRRRKFAEACETHNDIFVVEPPWEVSSLRDG
jgi:hypothetical protein